MPGIVDEPILGGAATVSGAQARSYLLRQPERKLTEQGAREVVDAFWEFGERLGIRPDMALAQACHETNVFRFGGQVPFASFNVAGIGATNDGAAGLTFPTWRDGIRAYYVHLVAWLGGPAVVPAIGADYTTAIDPRIPLVERVRARKGPVTTWRSLGGRWAVPGTEYGAGLERHWQAIFAQPQEGSMTVEQRFLAALGARDMRQELPRNPAHPYGRLPHGLRSIEHIAVHWTGDNFTDQTIVVITDTNYHTGGVISPRMTEDDEIDMLWWYAKYHIGKDGGTWGGIAYHITIFPSGRIYLNHDFATWTYHAFNANTRSIAVCCPNSRQTEPTPEQLVGLNRVLEWLCWECPEIPAGHRQVYGHKELAFIDDRNADTICPGTFLPHVRQYRESGKPTVPLADPAPAPAPAPTPAPPPAPRRLPLPHNVSDNPAAWHDEVTDKWVIQREFLDLYLSFGDKALHLFGHPVSGMYRDDQSGLTLQWFERARFELQADGRVTLGLVGAELARTLNVPGVR